MKSILVLNSHHPKKTKEVLEKIQSEQQSHRALYLYCYNHPDFEEETKQVQSLLIEEKKRRDEEDEETYLHFDTQSQPLLQSEINALLWFFERNETGHILNDHSLPTKTWFNTHDYLLDTQEEKKYILIGGGYPLKTNYQFLETQITDLSAWSSWSKKIVPLLNLSKKESSKELTRQQKTWEKFLKKKRGDSLQAFLSLQQLYTKAASLTPTARLHTNTDLDGTKTRPIAVLGKREDSTPEETEAWATRKKEISTEERLQKKFNTQFSPSTTQALARLGLKATPKDWKFLWKPYGVAWPSTYPFEDYQAPLFYGVITGITSAAFLACIPPYLYLQKIGSDTQKSLKSLKKASEYIAAYQADYGRPPNPKTWYNSKAPYTQDQLSDPVYEEITKIKQPDNPGWGFNTKLHLSLLKNGAEKAIILAPSYLQQITPNVDGTMPKQALSIANPTPTNHGLRLGSEPNKPGKNALYLTLGGQILLLNPSEAQKLLKTNPHSLQNGLPYWAVESSGYARALRKFDTPPPQPAKTQVTKAGIQIEKGSYTTPQILVIGEKTEIPIKISPHQTSLNIKIRFYNQYNQEINCTEPPTLLSQKVYGQSYRIYTNKPTSGGVPSILAINPQEGHSPQIIKPNARNRPLRNFSPKVEEVSGEKMLRLTAGLQPYSFPANTPLGRWIDTSQKITIQPNPNNWTNKSLTLSRENIPPFTQFITLEITNSEEKSVTIKNLDGWVK